MRIAKAADRLGYGPELRLDCALPCPNVRTDKRFAAAGAVGSLAAKNGTSHGANEPEIFSGGGSVRLDGPVPRQPQGPASAPPGQRPVDRYRHQIKKSSLLLTSADRL